MKNRWPLGIIFISIFMFLLPLLVFWLGSWAEAMNGSKVVPPARFIQDNWAWFMFNALVSLGILSLNKFAWFAAIGLSGWNLIKVPLGTAIGNGFMLPYFKGDYGTMVWAWGSVLIVSLPYAIVVGYLLRPDVKKYFISKDS